jgi:hypothetical protein
MKKIISGALFGAALMITGVLSFTSTEKAEAAASVSPRPTWCGDFDDNRCCYVWGWTCAPEIVIVITK